ncbi:MAG: hypothetical protein JNK61_04720 [Bacteroidia bacterium]|nr:hypothetical protein [Bacteroidia bacterium]
MMQLHAAINYLRCKNSILIMLLFCTACKTTQPVVQSPQQHIPIATKPDVKTDSVIPKEIEKQKNILNLGYIMPFYFETNALPILTDDKPTIEPQSLSALSFFQGAQLAIDSFTNENLKVVCNAYDLADSTLSLKITNDKQVNNNDFIFTTSLAPLRELLIQSPTPKYFCIQPVAIAHKNLAVCQPTNQAMIKQLALFIAEKNMPVAIIFRNQKKEKELAKWIQTEIDSALSFKNSLYKTSMFDHSSLKQQVLQKLDKQQKSIVLIASNDEAFIAPLIHEMASDNKLKIQIIGLPTWENYESLSFTDLQLLQTIIFNNDYLNFKDLEIQKLRKTFINKYKCDLSYPSYQGFYLTKNILLNYIQIKTEWGNQKLQEVLNGHTFKFSSNQPFNGYFNTETYFLLYNNFSLQKQ